MKGGLERIPGETELAQAYFKLQSGTTIAPDELALWARWTRFDPRLGEQCVSHLAAHWQELSPLPLSEANLRLPWSAALGLLLEFVRACVPDGRQALFRKWAELALHGVVAAQGEQFFIGLARLGGKSMEKDSVLAIAPYRKWGYLGRDVLISKELRKGTRERTGLSAQQRRRVLDELVARKTRLTLSDYLEALDGRVHRRQAERDLAAHPRLRPVGRTRARVYCRGPAR